MIALSSSGSRQLMSARNRPIESANAASEPRQRFVEREVSRKVTHPCHMCVQVQLHGEVFVYSDKKCVCNMFVYLYMYHTELPCRPVKENS